MLDKHLAAYTAKNSFDYFIHKDLGGFLRRELDFYLKNEVLNLDDLALGDAARLDRALARMRAVRHVADKLIDFLAQLENFQKRLWLKKKCILDTQYCVTLDRVPETLYEEIAANESQHDEWVKLFAIDEINNDSAQTSPLPLGEGQGEGRSGQGTPYTNPLTVDFLKANPYLVLDTRHFDADFTDCLLAALSEAGPLDEQMNGLLVHGENFQALNLLQARYEGQVNCIYIDPPYNTDASPILYKNGYKSSTWSSLMENSLRISQTLLVEDGVLVAAIDDEQQRELNFLLSGVFHGCILGTILVRTNPSGRPTQSGYSVAHEYLIYAGQGQNSAIGRMPPTEEQAGRFSKHDERGDYEWRNLRREGSNSDRTARAFLYYPIYIKGEKIRVPDMAWDYSANEWLVKEKPQTGEQVIYPDNEAGAQKTWRWEWKTVMNSLADLAVRKDRSGRDYVYYKRRPHEQGVVSISCWFDARYSATEHGTALLKAMFGESVFSYPKSIHAVIDAICTAGASRSDAYVLDYFAGSGTTGHAVINLNREDAGKRKYILVEVGHHFDTVLLPRIKKVIYSSDWKEGKPVSRKGVSQFFKYVRLESYEDTLDSLEVTPPDSAQQDLLEQNSELAEDYRLRYALGVETAGSACLLGKDFTDPFAHTLSVVRDGTRREVTVDLPETFNYLLGLHVESHRRIDGILAVTGMDPEGKHCLILWRNLNETDNAALETWFAKHQDKFAVSLDLIYTNGDHTLERLEITKRNLDRTDHRTSISGIDVRGGDVMSEDNDMKFFYNLQSYKAAIESLRPVKRPMLLWSVVSLVYVCGGLHLKVNAAALWGFQITGITGGKLTIFLFLATSYYTMKWLWSKFLKLRSYSREGFINELRNRDPQKIKAIGEDWGLREGFVEGSKSQGLQVEDADIINDKDFRGLVTDLTRFSLVSRAVTFMELFGVSFVFPLLVACSALVALLVRLL